MAAKEFEFDLIHVDSHILVVNKRAGMLSVPIPESEVKNLLDLVKEYYADDPAVEIHTAHRIDRFTSGLMVFAKSRDSYNNLFEQFKKHQPKRIYLAIVRGIVKADKGELKHYLKLVKEGFRNIVVGPDEEGATIARLSFRIKERFLATTLVEVELDTGLKNQIRVQFEQEGHQLVGDQHYAPEEEEERLIQRQALHAWKISLRHPGTGALVTYTADLPPDMLRLIDHYRWKKEMLGGKSTP